MYCVKVQKYLLLWFGEGHDCYENKLLVSLCYVLLGLCLTLYSVFLHVRAPCPFVLFLSRYLCWYHQARGAPCTPLCFQTAQTSSSHPCPSAVFPACPQTASCLLRGRRLPKWERERKWVDNVRLQRRAKSGSRYVTGEMMQAVEKEEKSREVPCHRTCINNRQQQQQCDEAATKRGWTSACNASQRHQSAVTRTSRQTNSIWPWLKCLSPSVLSEKLLRLSPSVRDQTSVPARLSPFNTHHMRITVLQTVLQSMP